MSQHYTLQTLQVLPLHSCYQKQLGHHCAYKCDTSSPYHFHKFHYNFPSRLFSIHM